MTASGPSIAPWMPDRADGTYRNPVLFADYSDPDVIRVGADYWLVASSFSHVPGLPILHSRDLVNWTIAGHALPRLVPEGHFATPRHGGGVWAPALRHHAGRFWIYYPDPDFGIYQITADEPTGPWSEPQLVVGGIGVIDPCPFWDEDGRVYLIHAWSRSRAHINNLLTLYELSADGRTVADPGTVVIDANRMSGWHTLEGPKLYRRGRYYYIFAPAGGVPQGYQAVFRARDIRGPYEARVVLDQGRSPVNGPHQGAWVDTPAGEHWFVHFQDRGPFGRVVHLQPLVWRNDWPVIGADPNGTGKGEPVLEHRKPALPPQPKAAPATSDEFAGADLGHQWQWQANPAAGWAACDPARSTLRLAAVPAPADGSLWLAPNLLLQKFPAPAFVATARMEFTPAVDGDQAGLIVFGYSYAWVGARQTADGLRLVFEICREANDRGAPQTVAALPVHQTPFFLRVAVDAQARCRFSYGLDGRSFNSLGDEFQALPSKWVGAKVGIFAGSRPGTASGGHADFDWFRVEAAKPAAGGR